MKVMRICFKLQSFTYPLEIIMSIWVCGTAVLPTVTKTHGSRLRAKGGTLAHCTPSPATTNVDLVEVLGGIKSAKKGTGNPTSQSRWPRTGVLSDRHTTTYGLYVGLTFIVYNEYSPCEFTRCFI